MNLTNPNARIQTSSFKLETFTPNMLYRIDAIESNLTINFLCEFPCKSCDKNNQLFSKCFSCYSSGFKYLFNYTCLEECGPTFYENDVNYTCDKCESPCLNCDKRANNCTSCIEGFSLKGFSCVPVVTSEMVYLWPFLISGFVMILVTFIFICVKKDTKFRESTIALVSWPEIGSWVAFIILLSSSP